MRRAALRQGRDLARLAAAALCLAGTATAGMAEAARHPAATSPAPRLAATTPGTTSGPIYAHFNSSPFPYSGLIPDTGKPFLDVTDGERHGHTSPRGGVLWEDSTYRDQHVLLYVPPTFDIRQNPLIVLFLHGNLATLRRDVAARQQVPAQLAQSKLNAVLIAPQFASNALDSSAGHFWESGNLDRFLAEASIHLAELYASGRPERGNEESAQAHFARMPVVIVAYSGGYLPAAFSLDRGGAADRIKGVVLLDALFGESDKFLDWIRRRHNEAFFVSAYSPSSRGENQVLRGRLGQLGIPTANALPGRLDHGSVVFLDAPQADHNNFVTQAWTAMPLKAVLQKVAAPAPAGPVKRPLSDTAPGPIAAPPAEAAPSWAGGLSRPPRHPGIGPAPETSEP